MWRRLSPQCVVPPYGIAKLEVCPAAPVFETDVDAELSAVVDDTLHFKYTILGDLFHIADQRMYQEKQTRHALSELV